MRVEESTAVYADAAYLAGVDLIVQCNTMNTIERAEFEGLRAAIAAGTGMAGWHGGIADSYRNSSDYLHLIGGQFACHPSKDHGELHGDATDNFRTVHGEHAARRSRASHHRGHRRFRAFSRSSTGCCRTTTSTSWPPPPCRPGKRTPGTGTWSRRRSGRGHWGEGRIFVATPGHSVEILKDNNVRTIIERGMLWASR